MKSQSIFVRAALAAVLAALMFASMGAAVRYSSAKLPNEMLVFMRNVFGLIFLLPWLYSKGIGILKTKKPGIHILRSLSGLAAMYCFFYAIANLQLAEAVLLNFTSPLFIALIALFWLGEQVSTKLALAILIGFIGICLILKPGLGILSHAAWIGLVSGFFGALAMVTIRKLSSTEPTLRIVFYFSITGTTISVIPLIWNWVTPEILPLIAMIIAGLAASLGQLLLTYSYSLAPAAKISPYSYTTVIFAAIYGWFFWSESLDIFMVMGAILIISAGIITLHTKSVPQIIEPD